MIELLHAQPPLLRLISYETAPALAFLELCSIADGLVAYDAILKRAPVAAHRGLIVHPGKYLIILQGNEEALLEALRAGRQVAGDAEVDALLLTAPAPQLCALITGPRAAEVDALGALETFGLIAAIRGADAALKAAAIEGLTLNLDGPLGGKGLFLFTGSLEDVEAGLIAGRAAAPRSLLCSAQVSARPLGELREALIAPLKPG